MSAYDVTPGASLPNVAEMTEFNMWTWNSRVFPGIDPLPVALGNRVRIRMGNLTMTNHPMHLHGVDFRVTMTDGGWIPESAQWPEATTDVPVGAVRALEFVADAPGDWAFHCHKSHHTMNAMGHKVKNFIGARARRPRPRRRRRGADGNGHGHRRHGGHGGDVDAASRQHPADDDRHWPVRRHRNGRHVLRGEGARGARGAATIAIPAGTSTRPAPWRMKSMSPSPASLRGSRARERRG